MIPHPAPFFARRDPIKEFEIVDSGTSAFLATAPSFSGRNFGAPAAGRLLACPIAGISGSSARLLNSVTIGGIAATIHIFRRNTGNSRNGHAAIASAVVPTGTSGDVVVTWSGLMTYTAIGIVRAINLNSPLVHATSPAATGDGQNSMLIDVPAEGFIVAAAAKIDSGGSSWTGATEFFDQNFGSDNMSFAAAGLLPATPLDNVAVNAGGSPSRYCCVSFG